MFQTPHLALCPGRWVKTRAAAKLLGPPTECPAPALRRGGLTLWCRRRGTAWRPLATATPAWPPRQWPIYDACKRTWPCHNPGPAQYCSCTDQCPGSQSEDKLLPWLTRRTAVFSLTLIFSSSNLRMWRHFPLTRSLSLLLFHPLLPLQGLHYHLQKILSTAPLKTLTGNPTSAQYGKGTLRCSITL